MLYPEIEKILLDNGYKVSDDLAYNYFCGMLNAIEWVSPTDKSVMINLQPTDEYEEELKQLEGKEVDFDLSRMEVHAIFFESVFVPECGFTDNSRDGIILQDKPNKYSLLDTLASEGGHDGMKYYYQHDFSYVDTAIRCQLKPFEQERFILECHLENLKTISECSKILEKYDFYADYSSLFDITKDNYASKDSSDPFVYFKFKYGSLTSGVYLCTDCLSGKLKVNDQLMPDNFEEWFIANIINGKHGLKLEFKYLFDSDYIPGVSDRNIWEIYQIEESFEKGYKGIEALINLDWTGVPMKDYQYLKDRIDKLINEKRNIRECAV